MTQSPVPFKQRFPLWTRLFGGLLSILLPGLGQIMQGVVRADWQRLSKGVFFLCALGGMFFYGMYLGRWKNVYLPRWQEYCLSHEEWIALDRLRMEFEFQKDKVQPPSDPDLLSNPAPATVRYFGYTFYPLPADMLTRLQFTGQMWIGLPAFPALWNYYRPQDPILTEYYPRSPGAVVIPKQLTEKLTSDSIQDRVEARKQITLLLKNDLNEFEFESNITHNEMGKMWDIAWVYTVLAGVLNILVIYDAFAGPFHPRDERARKDETQLPQGGVA